MNIGYRASFTSFALGIGLLLAPPASAAPTTNTWFIQLDDAANGFFAHDIFNGVEQLSNTSCGNNENCSLGEGFNVTSSSVAVNSTVHFNVFEADGKTLSDFGTATFFFEPNGSLQDFGISLNSKIDGFPITSPFTAADNPISLIETGNFQTVASITGVLDTQGNANDVFLQFRSDTSDVPEPAMLSLWGIPVAGLGLLRRRQQKAA